MQPRRGAQNVAHGVSRGYKSSRDEQAPEGRKKLNLNFLRPSGAFLQATLILT
jgi:hypothetical protein